MRTVRAVAEMRYYYRDRFRIARVRASRFLNSKRFLGNVRRLIAIRITWRCRWWRDIARKGTILASRHSSALHFPSRPLTRFLFLRGAVALGRKERARESERSGKKHGLLHAFSVVRFLEFRLSDSLPLSPSIHDVRGDENFSAAQRTRLHRRYFYSLVSPHLQVPPLFYPEKNENGAARDPGKKGGGWKKKTLRRHCLLTLSSRFSQLHEEQRSYM